MDNCIVINFPPGSTGHLAGRLIATCDNVAWYNHECNGSDPWDSYQYVDLNFTPFHFNRRFFDPNEQEINDLTTSIVSVLDVAKRNERSISYEKQKFFINHWKKKLWPKNFIYPLHSNLEESFDLFNPMKRLVIIPNDIDRLFNRYMRTTAKYFVNSKNKKYTFRDYYKDRITNSEKFEDLIRQDLDHKIKNYKDNVLDTDFIVEDGSDLLDQDKFVELCKYFDLEFNQRGFDNMLKFVDKNKIYL